MQIAEFTIGRARDVGWSAQRARLLGSLAGLTTRQRTSLGKAVAACVQLAVDASATGTVQFGMSEESDQQRVTVVLRIQTGTSTAPDDTASRLLAHNEPAFEAARSHVDDLRVEQDEHGQLVIGIVQALPDDAETISPQTAGEWSTMLATRSTQGALSTTQRRISHLIQDLQTAQVRGSDQERELENIKSLNETLELLALVASKTENAVIILDAENRVEWVNDGFVRMTGYELPDVQQKPIGEVLYGVDGENEQACELANALAARHGISQELLHHRKDDRTYWASISITPVFNETGDVTRWIGIANDATRRRHAQEELRQAKDAAESASIAKSEFLANMSHEIRTPMNAIIGMAELALDTPLNDEQQEYLTTVLDSAESLLRLLNDILDLSKIDACKLQIEKTEFSLTETLRDTLKAFTFQARQKDLRLDLQLPLNVPERVIGDSARLRQIVTNLVGNAIKFTHDGEVVVAVQCTKRTARHAELEMSVRDTGIGIAPEKLQQIFEAFTQADSSTTRRFGGTGLGLTISTQLVELMSGRIWVESEEGHGSTFHVALRFDLPSGLPAGLAAEPQSPPAAEPPAAAARKLSVLVADDNRANRQLAMRILQKHGDTVVEAEDGRAVIELLQREPFDVVLLDVQMPGMDGLEATAEIRRMADELPREPYIIAMTAHAMQGDRERCLAAGMDAYLAKPIRSRQLLALIDAVAAAQEDREDIQPEMQLAPVSRVEYDFSAALNRLEGDKDLLADQMGFFLEDSPILIRDIRSAVQSRDGKILQMAAHRLRGLAAGFDADELVNATSELEEAGRAGTISEKLAATCDLLENHWRQLCAAIEQHLSPALESS